MNLADMVQLGGPTEAQIRKDNPHFRGDITRKAVKTYHEERFPQFVYLQEVGCTEKSCGASYLWDNSRRGWILGAN